jgi:hypothetical protein
VIVFIEVVHVIMSDLNAILDLQLLIERVNANPEVHFNGCDHEEDPFETGQRFENQQEDEKCVN